MQMPSRDTCGSCLPAFAFFFKYTKDITYIPGIFLFNLPITASLTPLSQAWGGGGDPDILCY